MAFFPCKFYNTSEASYTPLFRLLEDFDNHYARQTARRTAVPRWQPKFDVRETEQAFELYGEFPGVDKENVNIKFTDPQTLLVHGKTERSYTSNTAVPAPAPATAPAEDATMNDTVDDSDKHSTSSYQATVEDDFEDLADSVSHTTKETETEKTEKTEPQHVEKTQPIEEKTAPKAKYWLTERSIGEFSRTFHFPTRVEQDGTAANFKDGILTVVVPKAKKHEARRISIN